MEDGRLVQSTKEEASISTSPEVLSDWAAQKAARRLERARQRNSVDEKLGDIGSGGEKGTLWEVEQRRRREMDIEASTPNKTSMQVNEEQSSAVNFKVTDLEASSRHRVFLRSDPPVEEATVIRCLRMESSSNEHSDAKERIAALRAELNICEPNNAVQTQEAENLAQRLATSDGSREGASTPDWLAKSPVVSQFMSRMHKNPSEEAPSPKPLEASLRPWSTPFEDLSKVPKVTMPSLREGRISPENVEKEATLREWVRGGTPRRDSIERAETEVHLKLGTYQLQEVPKPVAPPTSVGASEREVLLQMGYSEAGIAELYAGPRPSLNERANASMASSTGLATLSSKRSTSSWIRRALVSPASATRARSFPSEASFVQRAKERSHAAIPRHQ